MAIMTKNRFKKNNRNIAVVHINKEIYDDIQIILWNNAIRNG